MTKHNIPDYLRHCCVGVARDAHNVRPTRATQPRVSDQVLPCTYSSTEQHHYLIQLLLLVAFLLFIIQFFKKFFEIFLFLFNSNPFTHQHDHFIGFGTNPYRNKVYIIIIIIFISKQNLLNLIFFFCFRFSL